MAAGCTQGECDDVWKVPQTRRTAAPRHSPKNKVETVMPMAPAWRQGAARVDASVEEGVAANAALRARLLSLHSPDESTMVVGLCVSPFPKISSSQTKDSHQVKSLQFWCVPHTLDSRSPAYAAHRQESRGCARHSKGEQFNGYVVCGHAITIKEGAPCNCLSG